jgi:hypothetical protein
VCVCVCDIVALNRPDRYSVYDSSRNYSNMTLNYKVATVEA